uniref:Ig-like domain-containing protein n=1 Tax=Neolamprologus brichardi TaxID=32507 RepID=A0A3Q4GEU4_NEOBR
MRFLLIFDFILFLNTGSSLSDRVHQDPADMYKMQGQTAEITCSHSIDSYNVILWYKQTKNNQLQLLGHVYSTKTEASSSTHSLVGNIKTNIQAAEKTLRTLNVNNMQQNDSGIYFCPISKQ